jgi:SAM-dependent methyltransferase
VRLAYEQLIRLPAIRLASFEEFRRFVEADGRMLDDRYRREQSLGTKAALVELGGTCGVCTRVTCFKSHTAHGDTTPDGRRVPHWREQQECGCEFRLISRRRALLQRALPWCDAGGWCRAAILGPEADLAGFLASVGVNAVVWPCAQPVPSGSAFGLPSAAELYSLVLSADHLHCVPDLDAAFRELARVLMPGGQLLFTIPFIATSAATVSDFTRVPLRGRKMPMLMAEPVHQIGWDVLDRLSAAGFSTCAAYCYWSEELGYLGPYNMVFEASK